MINRPSHWTLNALLLSLIAPASVSAAQQEDEDHIVVSANRSNRT